MAIQLPKSCGHRTNDVLLLGNPGTLAEGRRQGKLQRRCRPVLDLCYWPWCCALSMAHLVCSWGAASPVGVMWMQAPTPSPTRCLTPQNKPPHPLVYFYLITNTYSYISSSTTCYTRIHDFSHAESPRHRVGGYGSRKVERRYLLCKLHRRRLISRSHPKSNVT